MTRFFPLPAAFLFLPAAGLALTLPEPQDAQLP
jgi:hypothetical protein